MKATDWSTVRIVAHRCGGWLAPENSLGGLDRAAALGYRAVEFDVMLSADREPVVIHDETLERTTTGGGRVADHRLADLRRLSCAKGWPPEFAEPVPTLDEVLQRCFSLGLVPNVEIKPSAGCEAITGEVVARRVLAVWQGLGGRLPEILLSSFSADGLAAARGGAPQLARALLVERIPPGWHEQLEALAATALHCAKSAEHQPELAAVLSAGVVVRCYTVNDPLHAKILLGQGVGAVFTDALAEFSTFRANGGDLPALPHQPCRPEDPP